MGTALTLPTLPFLFLACRLVMHNLPTISIFQSRFDTEGSKYFQKKIAEGKSKKLARKHLARQVSNQIWKILFAA